MSEVLVQFTDKVVAGGRAYVPRACGERLPDGTWHGWIEFLADDGSVAVRTDRETTQPNRGTLEYWATGLSGEYLEGALARALDVPVPPSVPNIPPPQTPPPAVSRAAHNNTLEPRAVLDPFAVYAQGEETLRQELGALSADHLRNIIRAYDLGPLPNAAEERRVLAAMILAAVRERVRGVRSQSNPVG